MNTVNNNNMEEQFKQRESTFGERLVDISPTPHDIELGLTVGPVEENDKVRRVKEICAELADLVKDDFTSKVPTYISTILYDHTIGEILNAQMNAVKLLNFKTK